MCCMLIDDEQLIFYFGQPVCLKQLSDDADIGLPPR